MDADGAPLRIEKAVFGGDGLARTQAGEVVFVPFVLPGERVQIDHQAGRPFTSESIRLLEPSPERTEPGCVHFGVCGGCQYQMADYPAQLRIKAAILRETLERAGIAAEAIDAADLQVWAAPKPYGYRNRIRLRVLTTPAGPLRLGYNVRNTKDLLPISMCPIAAPLLWQATQAVQSLHGRDRELTAWLEASAELELFCDGDERQLQASLLLTGKAPREGHSFARAMEAIKGLCPELKSAAAVRLDPRSGRALETYAGWGSAGLLYPVAEENYWISRGGFFQVNRFLLPKLVDLVCGTRSGALAWDLFAGVGLFSRVLARGFASVVAVEANPVAAVDLRRALARQGPQHRAVQATTLEFLGRAVVERDRPELVVLDPPRAGAGEEVCGLLLQLAPREIVYLSCDPSTLARDLEVLGGGGYRLEALHLVDLFPQTYHLETLAVLRRA